MIDRIYSLDGVIIKCRDLTLQRAFYEEVMGFQVNDKTLDRIDMRVGASWLILLRNQGNAPSTSHLMFRVNPDAVSDIEAYWVNKGVEIAQPVSDDGRGHLSVIAKDPEGNLIEVYAEIALPTHNSLLSKLTFEQVLEISEHCELQTYKPGEAIVNQGDLAEKFYVITKGHVKVVNITDDNKEILIGYLHTGDYFGEVGLLQSHPRTATIRAAEGDSHVHVIAINRDGFSELLKESPVASDDISQAMYDRLMEMAETIIRSSS